MSWWDTHDEWLARLDEIDDRQKTFFNWSYDILEEAYEYYWAADYNGALIRTMNCVYYMLQSMGLFLFGSETSQARYFLSTYFHNFAAGEITYKAICEAWGKDDFEGRAVTIAFIDRMRQLLWDEVYSATFAAKPEKETE